MKNGNTQRNLAWESSGQTEIVKNTGGLLRRLTIRYVVGSGCHTITVLAPAGTKAMIMTPVVHPMMGAYVPGCDMMLVTMPDEDVELTVGYRSVSMQEHRAHYKSAKNAKVKYWPPDKTKENK